MKFDPSVSLHTKKFFSFLGAFAKLTKAIIIFVMSVLLSDNMGQFGSH